MSIGFSFEIEPRDSRSESLAYFLHFMEHCHTFAGLHALMANLIYRGVDMMKSVIADPLMNLSKRSAKKDVELMEHPLFWVEKTAEPQAPKHSNISRQLRFLCPRTRHVEMHRSPGCSLLARRHFSITLPSREAVPLAFSRHEPLDGSSSGPPILLMHGLFGSRRNNRTISK